MTLAIEHRPKNLSELVGNQAVKDSLESIFARKKDFPHAYLLHGPTGCGKTTVARIIANMLDCSEDDLFEYNTANLRGIDTIRAINDNCRYLPMLGDVRVYILDEVHRQTKDAQNALLKLLEDPPSHVYFILCTTDPEQLLPTVRGRCHTFQMKPLKSTEMVYLLMSVLESEDISVEEYPKSIIKEIVKLAEGFPRNALVLLDSIIDIVDEESALAALSSIITSEVNAKEACQALLQGCSWSNINKLIKTLLEDVEPEKLRYAVLGYMNSVLLNSKKNDRASFIIDTFSENTYNGGKALLTNMFYVCCSYTSTPESDDIPF